MESSGDLVKKYHLRPIFAKNMARLETGKTQCQILKVLMTAENDVNMLQMQKFRKFR